MTPPTRSTHVPPARKRWTDDWYETRNPSPPHPDATETDPTISKLYGPKGEVLRTFSDRPPTGFHQGERGKQ